MRARPKRRAAPVKREIVALSLAARDPRVPWPAKLLAAATVAYAVSPIDLIPDFIPVIGYLDDAILLPLAVWLALWLIPASLMVEVRAEAEQRIEKHSGRKAGWAIGALWLGLAAWAGWVSLREGDLALIINRVVSTRNRLPPVPCCRPDRVEQR
ncbi:conserved hypothetical protein [uncultured Alphaproteobacteria bacterium]|uniref:DUF1232 domain-containing protein n=1 Tax=uncultured Alphaproteobacteria bacterium TaxID=91750 RepID=A0A212JEN0_9PROT|nr:conserved hypothetical protein [uncultured Alphaproteobacteria bacterium]